MVTGDNQHGDTGGFQTVNTGGHGVVRRSLTILGQVTRDEYQVRFVLQRGVQQSVPNRFAQLQHLTLGVHVLVKIGLLVNFRLRIDVRVRDDHNTFLSKAHHRQHQCYCYQKEDFFHIHNCFMVIFDAPLFGRH